MTRVERPVFVRRRILRHRAILSAHGGCIITKPCGARMRFGSASRIRGTCEPNRQKGRRINAFRAPSRIKFSWHRRCTATLKAFAMERTKHDAYGSMLESGQRAVYGGGGVLAADHGARRPRDGFPRRHV